MHLRPPHSPLFPYTTLFRSQTETGSIMISPLPGVTAAKPGSAMKPLPGISSKVVDEEGNELVPGADEAEHVTGYLVLDRSEEHTSELQSLRHLVCRLLLEKK